MCICYVYRTIGLLYCRSDDYCILSLTLKIFRHRIHFSNDRSILNSCSKLNYCCNFRWFRDCILSVVSYSLKWEALLIFSLCLAYQFQLICNEHLQSSWNFFTEFVSWFCHVTLVQCWSKPSGFYFLIFQDLIKSMVFEDYSTVLICKTAYLYGFGINLIEDTF